MARCDCLEKKTKTFEIERSQIEFLIIGGKIRFEIQVYDYWKLQFPQ